jgi:hypothetical protein
MEALVLRRLARLEMCLPAMVLLGLARLPLLAFPTFKHLHLLEHLLFQLE